MRSAAEHEVPTLHRLGLSSFQNRDRFDWGWTEEYLQYLLSTSSGFLHVAEVAGEPQIVGLHCGVWNYPECREDQCRFYWLYIDSRFRRRGIGTQLIQYSLARAAERGKRSAIVGIWGSDEPARQVVEHLGFQQVETLNLMRLTLD
ncbi:ribosomal protein S18 acetylase RimI-like enzyme [Chthoniobacter flavus]|nr:GNAT family N-acetyltransferase [Chthoniobacter flavus]TCO88740.1 ribosomal protein S18 acetylase RimI-like enzyme [Chthoniobacter flavus]